MILVTKALKKDLTLIKGFQKLNVNIIITVPLFPLFIPLSIGWAPHNEILLGHLDLYVETINFYGIRYLAKSG